MTYGFGKASLESAYSDAFGRIRTSSPISQFEAKFTYGNEEKLYNTTTANGGTASFFSNEAAWELSTTTASGSRVVRQSVRYLQYYPGKSQLIQMTGVFNNATGGCVKRIGYYDDGDGLFFVQNGTTGFGVGIRSSASGTVTETIIYQQDWNIDTVSYLDLTKTQIFVIDFQWLGVGAIRFGFVMDGEIVYFHKVNNANVLDKVYMKTAWLPLRYEIVNVTATATPSSMKQICSAVSSEGGIEPVGILRSVMNVSAVSVTTAWTPVISIRVLDTFASQQFRGKMQVRGIETYVTGNNPMAFAVVESSTLTNPVWQTVSTNSPVQYDVSATGITLGNFRSTVINARSSTSSSVGSDELSGYAGTIYTIVGRGLTGSSAGIAAINWREIL